MTFQVLSSGSSANAIIVTAGATRLLIDCGLSRRELFKRLHKQGYHAEDLTAILLTHEHGDHARGAEEVARATGAGIWDATPRGMHADFAGVKSHYHTITSDGKVFWATEDGNTQGVRVIPFVVPHDAEAPVGYLIEYDGRRIAIATDLGHIPPSVAGVLRLAHLLYLESNHDLDMLKAGPYEYLLRSRICGPLGHLSNDAAATFLREGMGANTEHVVLGHLSTNANTPELCEVIASRALADREYRGSLEVVPTGEVGARIEL